MPSIFFISTMNGAAWGGSEELWYKTALYALQKKWRVSCAVYDWSAKEERLQILEHCGAVLYKLPNKGVERKQIFQKIQFKITKKLFLKRAIRSLPFNKHDIVVINLGEFENTHSVWKDFYKNLTCFILLFHNYKEEQRLKKKQAGIMQLWIDHSALNLFASRRIMEVLQNHSEIKISNADILLNPISFPAPLDCTPYPLLYNGSYRFVMLAALETCRKAQDNLILALSSKKWKGRNWKLYLYGEGKDKQRLAELIIKNELAEKIFLEGHTNCVKSVLEKTHLLLQITHMDAMPLSVVEAMAVGRPVIASRIGDIPYWINEGGNGWISNNASVEQIDNTLEKVWQQKEQWAQIGVNAFSTFTKKFPSSAEENLLQKIEAVIKSNHSD